MLFAQLVGCIIDAVLPDEVAPCIDRVEGRNTQIKTDEAIPFTVYYVRGDGWKGLRESRLYERDELLSFLADQLPARVHPQRTTPKASREPKARQPVKSDAERWPKPAHVAEGSHVADSLSATD